jgi:hypothetical protein
MSWLGEHRDNPYTQTSDMERFMLRTGLTERQIRVGGPIIDLGYCTMDKAGSRQQDRPNKQDKTFSFLAEGKTVRRKEREGQGPQIFRGLQRSSDDHSKPFFKLTTKDSEGLRNRELIKCSVVRYGGRHPRLSASQVESQHND